MMYEGFFSHSRILCHSSFEQLHTLHSFDSVNTSSQDLSIVRIASACIIPVSCRGMNRSNNMVMVVRKCFIIYTYFIDYNISVFGFHKKMANGHSFCFCGES